MLSPLEKCFWAILFIILANYLYMIWPIQLLPICLNQCKVSVDRTSGWCFTWNNNRLCQCWWFYPQQMEVPRIRGCQITCRMTGMYLFGQKQKLHHALGCLTLNWKSNLYGYQKNLYWSVIGISIHYQMHLPKIMRTAQVIREAGISIVDQLNTSWWTYGCHSGSNSHV